MIRWLAPQAEETEIWGVDINARHIVWCQENLTPPFNFATVTIEPHLPFKDEYFDLIYCGSVFTHIDDLAYAWLLELKRIMRPGGMAYITVHDKHTADLIMNHLDRVPYWRTLRKFCYHTIEMKNSANSTIICIVWLPEGQSPKFSMTSITYVNAGDAF